MCKKCTAAKSTRDNISGGKMRTMSIALQSDEGSISMGEITEIRLHGRGGQGVLFAATVIAEAAFLEGKNVQAFGLFGAERRGAPVVAFVRAGNNSVMPRCRIARPDLVVVFDSALSPDYVLNGLKKGGLLLVNSPAAPAAAAGYRTAAEHAIWSVDATGIAVRNNLWGAGIPVVNSAILGAVAKLGLYAFSTLHNVLQSKLPRSVAGNLAAAREGYLTVEESAKYAIT